MGYFEEKLLKKVDWNKEAISIALWISLNLADLILTIVTMEAMDGGFVEGNPVAALIGENIAGLAGYKITLTFVAIVLLSRTQKLQLLRWLNIVMAAVVGWNLALLSIS